MANGDAVPNGIVNDVIAEAMVKSADGNDVIIIDKYISHSINKTL